MPIFAAYLRGFVAKFARYGRFADLAVAIVLLGLAAWWRSPVTLLFAGVSFAAFAVNLNGIIHRRTMAFASSRLQRRK